MEMNLSTAAEKFARATRHCDNLIEIHRNHGGPGQGRRDKETTLNRAVVVLTVAAWQAAVQDLAKAAVELVNPVETGIEFRQYALLKGRMDNDINAFATPNAEKTRELLKVAGFDPRPHWEWTRRGRNSSVDPYRAAQITNSWVGIRHAIAHGHATLPVKDVLQAVRMQEAHRDDPSLRLYDAEQCLDFFRRLARVTAHGLAEHLHLPSTEDWGWSE